MTTSTRDRLRTGIDPLDAMLHGGLPKGSSTMVAGPPGSGKTILAQQICCCNASDERRALYFSTPSEPGLKRLRHLSEMTFFREEDFDKSVKLITLDALLGPNGVQAATSQIKDDVQRLEPSLVVIDSFRFFDDLSTSSEERRRFGYELGVMLTVWECTTLLLGAYAPDDLLTNPVFSIFDGIIQLSQRETHGEQQRYLQVVKMRGTQHTREERSFEISRDGITIFTGSERLSDVRMDDPNFVRRQLAAHRALVDEQLLHKAYQVELEADISKLRAERLVLEAVHEQLDAEATRLTAENVRLHGEIERLLAR